MELRFLVRSLTG